MDLRVFKHKRFWRLVDADVSRSMRHRLISPVGVFRPGADHSGIP